MFETEIQALTPKMEEGVDGKVINVAKSLQVSIFNDLSTSVCLYSKLGIVCNLLKIFKIPSN